MTAYTGSESNVIPAPLRRHDNGSLAIFDPKCSNLGLNYPWIIVYAPTGQTRFRYSQPLSDKDISGANGWHLLTEGESTR